MIVDTSALVAILLEEPGHEAILSVLLREPARIGAPTLVEARVVVERYLGAPGRRHLEALVRQADLEVVDFSADHATVAADAYRDYGKGSGHSAGLNLGDVYSYALASVRDEPMLFVGNDFVHTDLRSAMS